MSDRVEFLEEGQIDAIMMGVRILCGRCYDDPRNHSKTTETAVARPDDIRYVGTPETRRCEQCQTVIPYGADVKGRKETTVIKPILDACCGGRMFWFDKENPNALFVDQRVVDPMSVGKGRNARMFECRPDKVMDFRKLDLPDEQFSLVVFDPPHLLRAGEKSYMAQKYGKQGKHARVTYR